MVVLVCHFPLAPLLVDMRIRIAQGVCGDAEQAVEWPIHLQYEEQGTADGHCAHEEHRENRCISRGQQPKADERDRQPASLPANASHLDSSNSSAASPERA